MKGNLRPLLVLAFLAGVGGLLAYLLTYTNRRPTRDTYKLGAFFESTGGIKVGAPVMLAGLDVGEVKYIELDLQRHGVKVTLGVEEKVRIPKDTPLRVTEKGMLGEMYLSFHPMGVSTEVYHPGEEIHGIKPFGLTDFMGSTGGSVEDAGREVQRLARNLSEILEDPKTRSGLQKTMEQLPQLMSSARLTIDENRSALLKALQQAESWGSKADHLLEGVQREIEKMHSGNVMDQLALGAARFTAASAKADATVEEARVLLSSLNHAEGTGGKLLKDPRLYDNLSDAAGAARDLLRLLEKDPSAIVWGRKYGPDTPKDGERRYRALHGPTAIASEEE